MPYGQEPGRREVAFLNRAWDDMMAAELALDESTQSQPLLDQIVNAKPSRCAGFEGLGAATERLAGTLLTLSSTNDQGEQHMAGSIFFMNETVCRLWGNEVCGIMNEMMERSIHHESSTGTNQKQKKHPQIQTGRGAPGAAGSIARRRSSTPSGARIC